MSDSGMHEQVGHEVRDEDISSVVDQYGGCDSKWEGERERGIVVAQGVVKLEVCLSHGGNGFKIGQLEDGLVLISILSSIVLQISG